MVSSEGLDLDDTGSGNLANEQIGFVKRFGKLTGFFLAVEPWETRRMLNYEIARRCTLEREIERQERDHLTWELVIEWCYLTRGGRHVQYLSPNRIY